MAKLWHIQNMECYSALKRSELSSSHEKTQRNLNCILVSESSPSGKAMYCMIWTICRSGKGRIMMETVTRTVVARG